jgi:hypothetical protein
LIHGAAGAVTGAGGLCFFPPPPSEDTGSDLAPGYLAEVLAMKATDLLKKQHREVKALFKKVEGTDNPRTRRELMQEIASRLEGHTLIEEEIFYPAVRGLETQKAEEMILEAYEEHHVVKLVLGELPRVNPEDERFEAKMTVLSELVQHHVEEEEKEMFKLAQKLGKDELTSLGEQMEERFEAFKDKASEAA